jgi:hypothetical protein
MYDNPLTTIGNSTLRAGGNWVYICKKCNQEIDKPKTWLWRKYCPMATDCSAMPSFSRFGDHLQEPSR